MIIKSNKYGMVVRLDPELDFEKLLEAVAVKFRESAHFFQDAKMALTFQGRTLHKGQEDQLVQTIADNSQIRIMCIVDERPEEEAYYQNAVAMAEASKSSGQFHRGDVNVGESLEFETSVVILGDVQPGANVTSRGNVVVLGSCRGTVYAGAGGDRSCFIAALVMKPIQIRVADKAARSAITKRVDHEQYALDPRIAYIKDDHIHVKSLVRSTLLDVLSQAEEPTDKDT
ncbi:MAG: septum site-determining protein MinC [Eubacteriales bacterium]|nr:septum site-determining protein MinC [Eubacteriales bacterium]